MITSLWLIIIDSWAYLQKGGLILFCIWLTCSQIFFYWLMVFIKIRRWGDIPNHFETELTKTWNYTRSIEKTIYRAKMLNEYLGEILDLIHEKFNQGGELKRLFLEIREEEINKVSKNIEVLQRFINVAPLLGLLGTVWGMISTFSAISLKSSCSTEMMATGISQALITTQFGLIVALPGVFGVIWIKGKIRQMEMRLKGLELYFNQMFEDSIREI